jgi:hypothetical protein
VEGSGRAVDEKRKSMGREDEPMIERKAGYNAGPRGGAMRLTDLVPVNGAGPNFDAWHVASDDAE